MHHGTQVGWAGVSEEAGVSADVGSGVAEALEEAVLGGARVTEGPGPGARMDQAGRDGIGVPLSVLCTGRIIFAERRCLECQDLTEQVPGAPVQ